MAIHQCSPCCYSWRSSKSSCRGWRTRSFRAGFISIWTSIRSPTYHGIQIIIILYCHHWQVGTAKLGALPKPIKYTDFLGICQLFQKLSKWQIQLGHSVGVLKLNASIAGIWWKAMNPLLTPCSIARSVYRTCYRCCLYNSSYHTTLDSVLVVCSKILKCPYRYLKIGINFVLLSY